MTKKIGIFFLFLSVISGVMLYSSSIPTKAEKTARSYGHSLEELDAKFEILKKGGAADPVQILLRTIQKQSDKQQEFSIYFLFSLFSFMVGAILVAVGVNAEKQQRQNIMIIELLQNLAPSSEIDEHNKFTENAHTEGS